MDPELPAAAAKGFRFTIQAPGTFSVPGNGAAVRIPLGRDRCAVKPSYRIVPGRSKAAYVTAEVTNSLGRPILRGEANLFTGTAYRGHTVLETVVPGDKVVFPLGVDDGVKVNRTIVHNTVQSGIVMKDDVTDYTVTIEVANHHRHSILVEVEDQVPIAGDKDVRVESFSASPPMKGPDLDGRVVFTGTVGARKVEKLTFKFRIVRPKDWEVRQHGG